ncbi:hypothetical protein AwEntero_23960 [Enterobacterales bacterium]|nr:hypothetical protein AwEntero_23960 [Enterobacterales bacterium]
MSKFKSVVTTIGQARIAAAIESGEDVNITHMAVGDGNGSATEPTVGQTALVHETYRLPLNSIKIDNKQANWIIAEAIIPASVGGFWMREMGLFSDKGELIAVSNMADSYKPTLEEGSGRTQTLRMVLTVTDTEAVSLTIDDTLIIATEEYVNDVLAAHEKSRNHPDGTLTAKGFVQLNSTTNSSSETLAATPKAVKAANDNANGRLPSGGTAVAATKLATPRKIAGVAFDGTADINLTATSVGAIPATGGNVGFLNNAAHYGIKPGTWEGVGGYSAQYTNPTAPFLIPYGFIAPKDISQYQPIIKGIIQTAGYGFAAAVSFGTLTSGKGDFPSAVISITGDNGTHAEWSFNPANGTFVSPGDVISGKNIAAGGGFYESTGTVRVYSPNNKPTSTDVNAIGRDVCSVAGFISGDPQAPYMRNSNNNEVVALARQDWAIRNFVTSITRGAQSSMTMDGGLVEAPAGCVLTGGNGNEGNQVGVALYRPLQMWRNGGWVTIEG